MCFYHAWTISLQVGTNTYVSQVCMITPGNQKHIYNINMGNDRYDNSFMSLKMYYTQGTDQSCHVFSLGWQYDSTYSRRTYQLTGLQSEMTARVKILMTYCPEGIRNWTQKGVSSPYQHPVWGFVFFCVFIVDFFVDFLFSFLPFIN